MTSKRKHTSKQPREQEYYAKTLRLVESEPTSEEGFEFPQSDDLEEEEVLPTHRERPRSRIDTLHRHFKPNRSNWITLAITASVAIVILILTNIIDIKEQLGRFEGMLQGITDTLKRHDSDITDIEKELQEQQKNLYEQGIQLEQLEK